MKIRVGMLKKDEMGNYAKIEMKRKTELKIWFKNSIDQRNLKMGRSNEKQVKTKKPDRQHLKNEQYKR